MGTKQRKRIARKENPVADAQKLLQDNWVARVNAFNVELGELCKKHGISLRIDANIIPVPLQPEQQGPN